MSMPKFPNKFFLYGLAFILAALIIAGGSGKLFPHWLGEKDPCRGASDRLVCQKDLLRTIYRDKGFAASLSYIKKVTYHAPTSGDCHFLMHELGRVSYAGTQDLGTLFLQGDSYCLGGYYHGLLEQHFAYHIDSGINAVLLDVCKKIDKSKLLASECYHGVGHALMYITKNDLMLSLKQCDFFPDEKQQYLCYFGAFMENSYAHMPEYHGEKKYVRSDDLLYPCTAVEEKYKLACYAFPGRALLHTRRHEHQTTKELSDYKDAFGVCQRITDGEKYRKECIEHVSVLIQIAFPHEWDRAREVCGLLGESSDRSLCYSRTAVFIQRNDVKKKGLAESFCETLGQEYESSCRKAIEADQWYLPELKSFSD